MKGSKPFATRRGFGSLLCVMLLGALAALAVRTAPAEVIEEIIAQVNDRVIVLSEYKQSLEALRQELAENGASGLDLEARFREQSANALRDLIDRQLLVQKSTELGLNADTEVIKRLDEIRRGMNLPSMEALEEAAAKQGMVFEDFKENLRSDILRQWVIQREVGSQVQVTPAEIKAYYDQHQKELETPEGVSLLQILVSTEEKEPEEIPALRAKAEEALAKAKAGEDFAQLAQQYSDDASASRGGNIGFFEKGSLSPEIESAVSSLERNQVSDIIETRYGFMILKVASRSTGGVPTLADAESRIHERLYLERIQPALREYLTRLRQESFISVKPGYVDSGAAPKPASQAASG
jgi:peptidyl-prolyl cis-trans isomerase SurA